jgi:hypothetical protein
MATPPARVAFKMCSMLNLSCRRVLTIKVARQLPVNEIIVLLMTRDFWNPFSAKYPALKEGQNIQRKRVPIIEKVELITVV